MRATPFVFSLLIVSVAFAQTAWRTPTETQADLTMDGRELKTPDIAQGRDLTKYDDGGHHDCRNHSLSDTAPRSCDYANARDFILAHWERKRRGYIRLTVDSVDTMSTSHIFIEPAADGWRICWRVAQARANGPSVVRDLPDIVSVERTRHGEYDDLAGSHALSFKGRDGVEQTRL